MLHILKHWGLRLLLAAVALFFLLTLALLGTHRGNIWLLAVAGRAEPRFAVTLESGILLGEATMSNFRWSSPGIDILIPHLEWRWDWQCLSDRTLCLDQLKTQGVRITLTEQPADTSQAEENRDDLKLPFALAIHNLQLQQSLIDIYGHMISLADLQLTARLDEGDLQISPLLLRDLQVTIAEATTAASDAVVGDEPLVLPEINLPLAIRLEDLDLETARINQGDAEYRIHRLQLSAKMSGSEVEVSRFEISAPEISLQAEGQIRLADGYPLSLNAKGKLLELPPLSGLETELSATGSVEDLAAAIAVSGPVTGQLEAKVKLLDPSLPFSAELSWQNLNWPIEQPALHSEAGQAELSGSLEGYSFQVAGDANGPQLPDLRLAAQGQGDSQMMRLDSLTLEALEGVAELDGTLQWGEALAWQGHLGLQQINPEELVPELPGQLSGQLDSEFLLRNGNWDLRLRQIELDGKLAGQPLRLRGVAQGNQAGDWQLSQLELLSGTNRLQVDGQIGEVNALQGQLDIVDLQTSLPGATGTASGTFDLSGKRDALLLKFTLAGESLSYGEYKSGTLDADGQLTLGTRPQGSLRLNAAELAYQNVTFASLDASFTGDNDAHSLSLDLQGNKYSAHSNLKGQLTGQLWSGQLQNSRLGTPLGPWILDAPLDLNYDLEKQQVAIAKHCWRSEAASLCLNEEAQVGQAGTLSVSLEDFSSSQVAELLPEGFAWHGNLAATASARWAPEQKPFIETRLSTDNGRFEIEQNGQLLQEDYQHLELSASLDETTAQAKLVLRSDQLGSGDISLQLDPWQEKKSIQSEFNLSGLQLSILTPLIDPLEKISGSIDAEGTITGTLQQPQVSGSIFLRDGYLDGTNLPTEIEKINLQCRLDNHQAQLDGDLLLGQRRAELAGIFTWEQVPVTGWLTLKGKRNRYRLEPELKLLVDPDLRLELQPEQLALTGTLLIPYGRAEIKALPQDAVRLSEDVVILDDPKAPKASRTRPLTLNINVTLQDDVKIEAFGLKSNLEGTMVISQAANQPLSGNGSIDLRKGTYRAFGQNLLINRGILLFSGPLAKPFIDVDAIRNPETTSDDVTAGIRLRGEVQKPRVTIYSEPAMSQQEAISYLLRGRSLGTGSGSSQDTTVATMLIGAGIGRSEGTISELGQAFGIKDLAVDTGGEGVDTTAKISGYVLPGVQVSYGVGVFSPISEITLRYEILPKLVLEAVSSLQSAIDLLYEFEF